MKANQSKNTSNEISSKHKHLMKATSGNYNATTIASKTVYLKSNEVGLERTSVNNVNANIPNSVPNQSFQNTTIGDQTK